MKSKFNKFLSGLALAVLATTPALAVDNGGPIDIAISAHIVGEQANGYLGFVRAQTSAQVELQRLVNEVNVRRRTVYTDVAARTNETIDRVALLQALRQITKAANGDYFKDTSGTWCAKSANSRVTQAEDGTIIIACTPTTAR